MKKLLLILGMVFFMNCGGDAAIELDRNGVYTIVSGTMTTQTDCQLYESDLTGYFLGVGKSGSIYSTTGCIGEKENDVVKCKASILYEVSCVGGVRHVLAGEFSFEGNKMEVDLTDTVFAVNADSVLGTVYYKLVGRFSEHFTNNGGGCAGGTCSSGLSLSGKLLTPLYATKALLSCD